MTMLGFVRGQTAESFLEIMLNHIPDEPECVERIDPILDNKKWV